MVITDEKFIENSWFSLVEDIDKLQRKEKNGSRLTGNPIAVLSKLIMAYQQSGRHHHNLSHIRMCIEFAQKVEHLIPNPLVVKFALFFHDVANDPLANDNEEMSVREATSARQSLGIRLLSFSTEVEPCIMATKHTGEKFSLYNQDFMADIDLAILASEEEEYQQHAKNIRKEYQQIDDGVFYPERLKILRIFHGRKNLYRTEYFRKRYYDIAKGNLQRELEQIEELLEKTPPR